MASRKMQLNLNIEELPNVVAWIADLTAERDAAVARAQAAEQALQRVRDICDKHEHGATRWADPLDVPEWIDEIRRALDGTP